VYEHDDSPPALLDLCVRTGDLIGIGHVRGRGQSSGAELVSRSLEIVRGARQHRDPSPRSDQGGRYTEPDTSARPADLRNFLLGTERLVTHSRHLHEEEATKGKNDRRDEQNARYCEPWDIRDPFSWWCIVSGAQLSPGLPTQRSMTCVNTEQKLDTRTGGNRPGFRRC
jgi:hypothetical protein